MTAAALANPFLTLSLAMIAGIVAQAISRHFRVPGIVLLLIVGVTLAPDGANLVRPRTMGAALPGTVSFSVAVILFEGALNLNLRRLRAQAVVIRRLITVGALVSALGGAFAARLLLHWDLRLALLFGTLVIVTGPTVVTPLLRRLRVRHGISTILEAEGVFIDAIGATVAIVALGVALEPSRSTIAFGALSIAERLGGGALIGLFGGALLALLLRWRDVIPEGLENVVSLAFAVAVLAISNALIPESGIAAVIVAGLVVGNARSHALPDLVEFKEQLTVLLIGTLFVLLAADVRIADVKALGRPGLVTVAVLMFVVRPIGVALSTWGTELTTRERLFLAWLAPRGIVAAAVASLFAGELTEAGIEGGLAMRALVFLVIAVTVTVEGLLGAPIAWLLDVKRRTAVGHVLLGANEVARAVAGALRDAGEEVVLVDNQPDLCRAAEDEGFKVIFGNGLADRALAAAQAESRASCIGLTTNENSNLLFVGRVREQWKEPQVLVAVEPGPRRVPAAMLEKIRARVLFGAGRDVHAWSQKLRRRQVSVERWEHVAHDDDARVAFEAAPDAALLPLVLVRDGHALLVDDAVSVKRSDELVVGIANDRRDEADAWLRHSGFIPRQATDAEARASA